MAKRQDSDPFSVGSVLVPRFGSGEVAQILRVELWKLNRFLSRYELKSSGQLGQGRGSRRFYNTEDIYRLATAMFLIRDGFAPKTVNSIMQQLEDEDFYGGHDERGEFAEFGISLRRTDKDDPEVRIFRASSPPDVNAETKTYYVLNLSTITRDVNREIASRKGK